MTQTDQAIKQAVGVIKMTRPTWSEWAIRDALTHAVRGGYVGTDRPDTLMAYAVAIIGKPAVQSAQTLKWPAQWHWAANLLDDEEDDEATPAAGWRRRGPGR